MNDRRGIVAYLTVPTVGGLSALVGTAAALSNPNNPGQGIAAAMFSLLLLLHLRSTIRADDDTDRFEERMVELEQQLQNATRIHHMKTVFLWLNLPEDKRSSPDFPSLKELLNGWDPSTKETHG